MSRLVYVLAEGVLDIAVIAQIFRAAFGLVQLKKRADLPEPAAKWLSGFKWPVNDDAPHEELAKPAGFKKAHIAAMIALLKPMRAAQTSIEDHRWIPSPPTTLLLEVLNFLADLVDRPRPKVD